MINVEESVNNDFSTDGLRRRMIPRLWIGAQSMGVWDSGLPITIKPMPDWFVRRWKANSIPADPSEWTANYPCEPAESAVVYTIETLLAKIHTAGWTWLATQGRDDDPTLVTLSRSGLPTCSARAETLLDALTLAAEQAGAVP